MKTQIYIHTCFITIDFGIYSRHSESFKIASFNKNKPKLKPAQILASINAFIKKDKEAQDLFKKYGLKNWEMEVEKTKLLEKYPGLTPNLVIIDETLGQDTEPVKKSVKRI